MVRSSPAIWDGHFCVGSYDSKIYCFSDNTTDQKDIEENKETKKPIEPPDTIKWEIFIGSDLKLDFVVTNETTTVLSRVDRYRNQMD
ncbi:MAG: PQQ-binding-like beta-propeller repeat protein, partial [Caldisericia bacterium]|nr:PQQ-binding-like beta-propeller repeat protein [Caldisericia bacterium]